MLAMRSRKGTSTRGNVIDQLLNRELFGTQVRVGPSGDEFHDFVDTELCNHEPFRRSMLVEDVIATSAMEQGNVFLGFTPCNTYLLSYTIRPASESDVVMSHCRYTLHFWLFRPNAVARKVMSVKLFDNKSPLTEQNLLIEIAQWPSRDRQMLLITGHSATPSWDILRMPATSGASVTGMSYEDDGTQPVSSQFYSTITTIPNVSRKCDACSWVVATDEEDEDDWEINERRQERTRPFELRPCPAHGVTVHVTFPHVSPYPQFNAHSQLTMENAVLFNTGNLLHVFKLKTDEDIKDEEDRMSSPLKCYMWCKKMTHLNENDVSCENAFHLHSLVTWMDVVTKTSSIFNRSSTCLPLLPFERLQRWRSSSQLSSDSDMSQSRTARTLPSPSQKSEFKMAGLGLRRSPARLPSTGQQQRKFFKREKRRRFITPSLPTTNIKKSSNPYDILELNNDSEDPVSADYGAFRRRKLAEKKYEFNEENNPQEEVTLGLGRRTRSCSRQTSPTVTTVPNLSVSPRRMASPRCHFDEQVPWSPGEGLFSPSNMSLPSPKDSSSFGNESSSVLRPVNKIPECVPDGGKLLTAMDVKDKDSFEKQLTPIVSNLKKQTEQDDATVLMRSRYTLSKGISKIDCTAHINRRYHLCSPFISSTISSPRNRGDGWGSSRNLGDSEIDEFSMNEPSPMFGDGDYMTMMAAVPVQVFNGNSQLRQLTESGPSQKSNEVILLSQKTLDVEILCNEVAEVLCNRHELSYSSCVDFDVAVLQTSDCSSTPAGIVTSLVIAVVQADKCESAQNNGVMLAPSSCSSSNATSNTNKQNNTTRSRFQRRQYEMQFLFSWDSVKNDCFVLCQSLLKEYNGDQIQGNNSVWHPAQVIAKQLHSTSGVKTLDNHLAVMDCVSLDSLQDWNGVVTLYRAGGGASLQYECSDHGVLRLRPRISTRRRMLDAVSLSSSMSAALSSSARTTTTNTTDEDEDSIFDEEDFL